MMSLYQRDDASALKHLALAEEVLSHQANISQSEHDDELARILRYRTVRASHADNQELAGQTLQQLNAMAGATRSAVVQSRITAPPGHC